MAETEEDVMVRGEVQNIASAVGWYRLLTRNKEMFAKEEKQRMFRRHFFESFRPGEKQCN